MEKANSRDRKQISGFQGPGMEGVAMIAKSHEGTFWSHKNVLDHDGGGYMTEYI